MHILFLDSNHANLLHLSVFVPFFQIIGCLLFGFLIRGLFRFVERQKLLPYIKIDFFNLCKSSLLLGSNAHLEDRMSLLACEEYPCVSSRSLPRLPRE